MVEALGALPKTPRVVGSPDSVMLLSAFVPADAVAFGLRSPAFSQSTTMGYFPALESFMAANAPDRRSAVTWALHLEASYRMTEIRSGKGVRPRGSFWNSAPNLLASPTATTRWQTCRNFSRATANANSSRSSDASAWRPMTTSASGRRTSSK